ncbi:MAG: PAS domain S-box protein [bacterium]|nr:PAS domain S-box protein [bacterium]
MKNIIKILHLEDTPSDAALVERELKKGNIQFEKLVVGNKTAFEKALNEFNPDIILSDHSLPSFDSIQAIQITKQKGIKIPFILVSATVSDEYAVEVMKAGADDYVLKDRLHRLPQAVMNAMEKNKAVLDLQLAYEKILYTNRLYSFISHVSQTIVHVTDEQQVFKEVCRIAIEFGKFKAAWIGLIDTVNQKINLEEGNGILPEYLAKFKNVSYQDHGPQYHVLKTNSYYICNNIQQDLELKDWKLFVAENGFNALMVLPIRKSGNIIGTFNLYAAEINFFNAAEIALLTEAADDISFALEFLEKEKLRATAESNLQTIFENTSEGFILFDTNGIVKSFNTKFAQTILLNTEKEIKIGGHLYDYILPSRKEGYESNISKVLAGENIQYNRFFERKNGDIKWFSFTINPAYNEVGVIEGFCIKSADITEAKQAEEALQKSESNLQAIFENTSEGFILTDLNGNIKVFNQNANNNTLLNSGQEITIGSNIFDYIQPSRKENYKLTVSKVLLGETIKYDHYYERKNGEIKWFNFAITPAHNAGNIIGVCITSADITDRKQSEQLLRESQNRLETIIQSNPECIKILNKNCELLEMNPAGLTIIEAERLEQVKGTAISNIVNKHHRQAFIDMNNAVLKGESRTLQFEITGLKGSNRWLETHAVPLKDSEGKITTNLCVTHDITEQKNAEQLLRESESFNKGVLSSLSSHIAVIDDTGNIIAVNKAWNNFAKANGVNSLQKVSVGSNYIEVCQRAKASGNSIAGQTLQGIQSVFNKDIKNFELEYPCHSLTEKRWFNLSIMNFGEDDAKVVISHQNITNRKIAEEANRFKANLLNTIGQAAIATDINGVVNYWNKAAENIYGWTKEEALGKNIMDLTTSETSNEQAIQIMEELKKGQTWAGEFKVQKKDGTNFPVHITNSPIHDENNILSGIIGISTDITEKKKLEDLLGKTNRLAAIGSWEIDVVKGTVFWSDITKEIREADKDYVPLLEVGISQFKEGIGKETINQRVQECIEHGTSWDEELQIITLKGNHKWIRTIGEGEFLNGKCIKIHGSFQDINIRKNAEQLLQQSQANLQAIIENTDASIYSLDTEFRYIAFNKTLYENIKQAYNIDIKIGENSFNFLEKLEPEEAKAWKEIYSKVLQGEIIKFEKEFIIGEFHNHSSFSLYPLWENKTIIGLSCFVYDITKQKQDQLDKEKMTADIIQRNRDLEQFSYIISHNLRAPAANIIACAEILQDETITPQEQKAFLHGLSVAIAALDTIIKDLNKILQVKSEVNEQKEVVIFSKLVSDIKISIGNLIEKHGVHIISDFSKVDEIYSLKIYIYSIFYNLIGNSIKYGMPNESPRIEIKSKKENGKIILTFKDNGLGFDMKTQADKVFGLYKRFHSHVEGKGMGLFMVKAQVESLGGKISIASEPNKGTEFTIVFDS